MVHPSDGDAWTHFDGIHRVKVEEARNVRVALATDGINPYGLSAAPYTCWPVFVIPLFMEPVFDDLIDAWEKGVLTYDQATKRNFTMHVWYHYSLHDFLAYGLFYGWCVHGEFPCPIRKAGVRFTWLKSGGKFSLFDQHH
jgi:hypothetical protein